MKEMKHRLGQIYWKFIRSMKRNLYDFRKTAEAWWIWIRGGFVITQKRTAAVKQAKTVVVCAHPDDETIFFSSVLKKEKPFVVCVSHRGNAERRKEFCDALEYWGVQGIMLNFPDVPGLVWIWKWRMKSRLLRIRKKMLSVSTVYTHSCSGESGHPHHYAVHNGVEKAFLDCKIYTTARTVPENGAGRLDEAAVEEKYGVVRRYYSSQIKMLERWCPWWQDYLNTECFEE